MMQPMYIRIKWGFIKITFGEGSIRDMIKLTFPGLSDMQRELLMSEMRAWWNKWYLIPKED